MMARSKPTGTNPYVCTCDECRNPSGTCDHAALGLVSPDACCDTLLKTLDFNLPASTVIQCSACLRLWEWCGTIDGKGVVILIDPDLAEDKDVTNNC